MDQTEPTPKDQRPQAETPTGRPKTKKERRPKPAFDLFLEQWRASLADGKGCIGRVRSLLKKGFTGDVKQEYVLQLSDALMQNLGTAERLAVLLATQSRIGKLNFLSRSLLEQIRTQFGSLIDYHSDDFAGTNGAYAVERFVETNAPQRRGTDNKGQHGAADEGRMAGGPEITADSWLRRFFVCLCSENEPKVFLNGTIAAGRWWLSLHSRVFVQARGDTNLARAFSNVLCAGAVSRPRLELIFTGIGPLQQQFTALLNRELELARRVQNRDAQIDALTREKTDLESCLATLEVDKAAAQERSTELQQSLTEAEERCHLLDQHWRAVSEQSLDKQGGFFRGRIGHELQEALLSPQRESPNVSMALLRLKRIDEILKNATPREE